MFDDYYITTKYKEPIYFSIITLNKSAETSLYVGKQLVRRNSLQRGIHVLEKDEIKLKLQLKMFKALPELYIENEKVEIDKIKRKDLRKTLDNLNINNELNPKKIAAKSFNYKQLRAPLVLIFLGALWQYILRDFRGFWEIPSMLFYIIAFYQLGSPLINKVPDRHMDHETKGKFKFLLGIGFMILARIGIDEMINYIV